MEGQTNNPVWFSNLGAEYSIQIRSGNYPEVKSTLMLNSNQQTFLSYGGKRFTENKIYQTNPGSNFFDFFNFELIEGQEDGILDEPYAVIITESIREKYFEDGIAIGESLKYDSLQLKVTGVIQDLPTNSHLDFEILFTNPRTFESEHFHTNTYIELVDGASPKGLEAKILAMQVGQDEFHTLTAVSLIGLPDIYFDSAASFGSGGIGDKLQLTVFMVIGGLILLIAVANYVNLSLAGYSGKGLEIGIRKVLGESRQQIISAFICESLLVTLLSLPFLFLWLKLTLPVFGDFLA